LRTPGGTLLGPSDLPIQGVPAFCRIGGVIKPSSDSNIHFEVWMPEAGWNGKFRAAGNGGFAGSINFGEMAAALRDGFATASTDTGHSGSSVDAGWALGHPEKIIDFGYRAIHEMTVNAKAILQAFYGQAAQRSYFASCSNGGRQALMEAQRFPEDYDGILAGAPANYWTHLLTAGFFTVEAPMVKDPANYIPAGKVPAINGAVLAACDAQDGLKDGILNQPVGCHFDPATLLCQGAESDSCLTGPQVATLKKIYAGARNAQGKQICPGSTPGGEDGPGGWPTWITGTAAGQSLGYKFGIGFFRNMVFDNASWEPGDSNLEAAMKAADAKMAHLLNATDANLKPFQAHGGKLILYHGWSDAAIPPLNAVNYYTSVVSAMPGTENFVRLYMVPGMQHCADGPGPSRFGQFGIFKAGDVEHDISSALEAWVEKGIEPRQIIATKYLKDNPASSVEMTRPLCPYPRIARYNGAGDPKDAANFTCVSAER
jgi:feruloyl esterase